MPDHAATVARFADQERMFRRVTRLLVAVSGGGDSVAALLLLRELRERYGFELIASHFDHQLRPDSAEDLRFVRDLCGELDVPCFTGEGDVRSVARERKASVEDAARKMRYQFLEFVAGKERADAIATGHTADDQVETVLHRVVRGSGVRGIRGMLPAGTVPGGALRLVRPLLVLRRVDTVAICLEAGITPRSDPSNAELEFTRNRIRHEVLPALREVNPAVGSALLGLAASAREAFTLVEQQSYGVQPVSRDADGTVFRRDALAQLPAEALMLVIEREAAFAKAELDVNRTRIRNLRDVLASGSGVVRFGEVEAEASCGFVRVGPALSPIQDFEPKVLNVPGVTIAGPWRVQISTEPQPDESATVVDSDVLHGALRLRPPAPGDRISVGGHTRKLSDVLTDAKVPRWRRREVLVLTDGKRVVGLTGPARELLPAPSPESALYVSVTPRE